MTIFCILNEEVQALRPGMVAFTKEAVLNRSQDITSYYKMIDCYPLSKDRAEIMTLQYSDYS